MCSLCIGTCTVVFVLLFYIYQAKYLVLVMTNCTTRTTYGDTLNIMHVHDDRNQELFNYKNVLIAVYLFCVVLQWLLGDIMIHFMDVSVFKSEVT